MELTKLSSLNQNYINKPTPQKKNAQYKKPSITAIIGGAFAGKVVKKMGLSTLFSPISQLCMSKISETANSIPNDSTDTIKNNMPKILDRVNLSKKGVEVVHVTEENEDFVKDSIYKDANQGLGKFLTKARKEMESSFAAKQAKNGVNAFYSMSANKIFMPQQGMEGAFFHELGHALNSNMGKISKVLQRTRSLNILTIPLFFVALLKTKKAPNEKPKNTLDKATTFIKKNIIPLTFLCYTPILFEEGMASIKGHKIAKNFVNSDTLKKISKINTFGFLSYLSLAVISSLASGLGVKIKDLIAKPKEIKQNSIQ